MVEDGEQPGEGVQTGEQAESEVRSAPPRRRRRAASRPAGPPVHEQEADQAQLFATAAPAVDEPTGRQETSDQPTVGAVLDAESGAQEDAGPDEQVQEDPVLEEAETEPGESATGDPDADSESADVPERPGSEADAPDSAAPEGAATEGVAPQGAATEADAAGAVAPESEASPDVAAASAPRRPRRATRGVTTVAFSAVPEPETPSTVAAAEVPAAALFQPPDETKAVRRSRSTRAASRGTDTGPEDVPAAAETGDSQPSGQTGGETTRGKRAAGGGARAGAGGREADSALTTADLPAEGAEDDGGSASTDEESAGQERSADDAPRRRRRRGGRRRRRPTAAGGEDDASNGGDSAETDEDTTETQQQSADSAEATEPTRKPESPAAQDDDAEGDEASESTSARRRRRRRRRAGVAEEMEDLSVEDPPNTVVKVREGGRRPKDEITSVRGSTRIEAKKQRRRDGREAGRRRPPILSEAEFLARREAVSRVMCVREHGDRKQIAVLEDGILVEHYVNRAESSSLVGNVYVGKVQNVLPSMEAAFVDIGRGRNAVLYAGEVNWDAAGLEGQPKRIELALKSGDPVLVQVTKDPIGHKGARLTSQISLPGRFLVYVPEGSMTGISRKLPDTERGRLKGILKDVVPDGAGVIVRTAAEGASEEQLTADVTRLAAQWTDITKKAKSASPPSLLYGEPDLAIKVVRDIFNEDFTELLVQGESTWVTLSDYIGRVAPDLLPKMTKWVDNEDLYAARRIDEQLAKALDRKVWLPSGGSLVIDRTEAMTVVDVNTGKFTGQGGNLEETVTSNNLEAAEEIVRQLRLRDIGGIIVVDFIDMVLESNRDLVLRRLVECLGRDRTKHQVAEVTSLGLVQMTRKRIGQGLLEVFSTPCEHCGGRGHLVSAEPVSLDQRSEDNDNRRDRGPRRARKKAPAALGGKQTGRTPPPPRFDEEGHPHHDDEGPVAAGAEGAVPESTEPGEVPERAVAEDQPGPADVADSANDEPIPEASTEASTEAAGEPDTQAAADPAAEAHADHAEDGSAQEALADHAKAGSAQESPAGSSEEPPAEGADESREPVADQSQEPAGNGGEPHQDAV